MIALNIRTILVKSKTGGMIKLKNIIKKLISDPKVQKAVKEKVVPLVKKEIEKRRGNK